jgi:hypothetical protein
MMTENEFLDVVELTSVHPGLYTPTGSFFEFVGFLEGFGSGAKVNVGNYHSVFTPFHQWLVQKFDSKDVIVSWVEFRSNYDSDDDALRNFVLLYGEYVVDTTGSGKLEWIKS